MEEFGEEDDFGDLYADVEVQASSAINAMHELKEMQPRGGVVPGEGFAANSESKLKRVEPNVVASLNNTKSNCPAGTLGEDNNYHSLMDMDKGPVIRSRNSRPSPAQSPPVAPDPDMYGCVQISDSEDSIHEFSDCDADGMAETSNITNKVNIGSIPDNVQSVEQRGRSQHCAAFSSCSRPSTAVNNDERQKIHMRTEKSLPNSATELPKPVALDDQYCKRSKSDGVKLNTRESRYCVRDTHPIGKELMQQKTNLNGKDIFHEFDGTGVCGMPQMQIGHVTSTTMFSQGFNETNMPYYSGPGSAFTYFHGLFPYHHFGPAYPANHYWNGYPAFGYQVGLYNGHNMNGGGYVDRKRTKMDSEILQGDWYHHNGNRHVKEIVNFKDATKLVPRTSFADGGGTQFSNKSHNMEFKRRRNEGGLLALGEHHNDSMVEKYRRYSPSAHSDKEHLDPKDRDIPCDKRGVNSLERIKRRRDDPLNNSFDSLCQLENEENERKYIKHQSLHVNKEPTVPSRKPFQGASGPKSSTPETYLRSSRVERHKERVPDGIIDPIFCTNEVLMCHQGEDHSDRRRHYPKLPNHDDSVSRKHHQLCKVLPENEEGYYRHLDDKMLRSGTVKNHHDHNHFGSRNQHRMSEIVRGNEEEYKSRHLDDKMFRNGRPSYQFERNLRDSRTGDRVSHEYDVADFIDEREADKHFHIMKRNCDSSNQFDLNPRFVDLHSHFPRHLRYQDSVDPELVCDKKSCKRAGEVQDAVYHNRHDFEKLNGNRDFEELNDFKPQKVVAEYERKSAAKQWDSNMNDMSSQEQKDTFLDIEEGEIINEDTGCIVASVDEKESNFVEHPEAAPNSNRNKAVERLDEQRIQEIRAKMEKRRERFREPISLKKNPEPIAKHVPDLVAETTEVKMERPARKRRWVGS